MRRAVNIGAQAADLKLVGIGTAHVKTDDVSSRDAHAIGIGVDARDGHGPMRGEGRQLRFGVLRSGLIAGMTLGRHEGRGNQGASGGSQEFTSGRIGHVETFKRDGP